MTIAVHIPTKESYDRLMELYDIVGWRWASRTKATEWSPSFTYVQNIHVNFRDQFRYWSCSTKEELEADGYTIITVVEAEARLKEMYPEKADFIHKYNNPPKKSLMQNIKDVLKNALLSDTDRILRENNLEDEHGDMTTQAMDLMEEELYKERWATRRTEVAEQLLKIEKK